MIQRPCNKGVILVKLLALYIHYCACWDSILFSDGAGCNNHNVQPAVHKQIFSNVTESHLAPQEHVTLMHVYVHRLWHVDGN